MMRVMDNSPIDVPTVGRLVKEKYALGQLVDCCLYVLPSNAAIGNEGKKVFDELMKSMGENQLLNKYDYEVLEKMPALDSHPTLSQAIEEEKCQFVLPINTPTESKKQYLLLHTETDKLYSDIAMMVYTSERISKHSYNELLRQYALDTPEDFCGNVKDAIKSEKFWKNYFVSIASNVFNPTFGMAARLPKIKEVLNIDGIITYQKKNEMMDRMIENIYKVRRNKDKEANAELDYVLNSLDVETLKALVLKMSKSQLETFFKTANPKLLAKESTMTLEIRYVGKTDPVFRADGRYRLFLHKGYDQIQVHFGLKDAFILYLIYIIDKHERANVDTLKIENYKDAFVRLFEATYDADDTKGRFDRMVRHYDDDGNPQQAQIKHCYSDIRTAISDGCEKLREQPSPFFLSDPQSHLYVMRDKISIPQNLIDLMKG